jgi:hypothetical protein
MPPIESQINVPTMAVIRNPNFQYFFQLVSIDGASPLRYTSIAPWR